MHSFEVSLGYESVDRTTFSTWSAVASLEMYFGQRFHTRNETSKECIQFLIILCDYLNLSLADEHVGDVTIPTQVIEYN